MKNPYSPKPLLLHWFYITCRGPKRVSLLDIWNRMSAINITSLRRNKFSNIHYRSLIFVLITSVYSRQKGNKQSLSSLRFQCVTVSRRRRDGTGNLEAFFTARSSAVTPRWVYQFLNCLRAFNSQEKLLFAWMLCFELCKRTQSLE